MNLTQANIIELCPNAVRTSTPTLSAVDVRKYEGVGQIILTSSAATAGTSPTLTVKLQHALTSGGQYDDIAGATFTQVTDAADTTQMIPLDFSACRGFIKVVATIAGTDTPTFSFAVTALAQAKSGRNSSQSV